MSGSLRPLVISAVIAVVMTIALALVGVMHGPLGTTSFLPADAREEEWITRTMPEEFAQRGRDIGVARWTPEATFFGDSAWAEERAMTLGPMSERGGFLDPEESLSVWRFRVGWPLPWAEMSAWTRGPKRIDVCLARSSAAASAGFRSVFARWSSPRVWRCCLQRVFSLFHCSMTSVAAVARPAARARSVGTRLRGSPDVRSAEAATRGVAKARERGFFCAAGPAPSPQRHGGRGGPQRLH
jgi:hypothetical protein